MMESGAKMSSDLNKANRLTKAVLLKDNPIYQNVCACHDIYSPELASERLKTHDIFEISIVTSGSGIHCIQNQAIPCSEGDIYIVSGDIPHMYFLSEDGGELVVRHLYFDIKDWFDGDIVYSGSVRYCYGVFSDNALTAYAMLTSQTLAEINSLCHEIEKELDERKIEWNEAVRAHLSMILIKLGRYVKGAIKNEPSPNHKEWSIVSTAMNTVMDHFAECELTLESIAESMFISKSHLSRLFKRLTGRSFTDYLRGIRLEHACHLLEDTDLNIEEIVKQCGLRDIPSFYRSFGEKMNMTPNCYRKTQKSKSKNIFYKGETTMSILTEISENLQKGKAKIVKELVQQALDEGVKASDILNDGLLAGMGVIGEKFKNNEVYVPEVLVAARAMNMGTQVLKPHLAESGVEAAGKVCIGTVQGDLHDIGKNLVKMMMEGKGLEVVDLGTDVSAEAFVNTAIEQNCQIICCSALLTTTMGVMEEVVKLATEKGIRDKVKIMIGGAPTTTEFCQKIGADCYTADAASAADAAIALCKA